MKLNFRELLQLIRENTITQIVISVSWTIIFLLIHTYIVSQSNWAFWVALLGLGYLFGLWALLTWLGFTNKPKK